MEVLFRPLVGDKSELHFILKSWIRSFAKSPWSGPYPSAERCKATREGIRNLLGRKTVHTLLACDPHKPSLVWGFCCYETGHTFPLLHFIYVKDLYRRMRIGSDLVAIARGKSKEPIQYTYRTKLSSKFLPDAKHRDRWSRRTRKEASVASDTPTGPGSAQD